MTGLPFFYVLYTESKRFPDDIAGSFLLLCLQDIEELQFRIFLQQLYGSVSRRADETVPGIIHLIPEKGHEVVPPCFVVSCPCRVGRVDVVPRAQYPVSLFL